MLCFGVCVYLEAMTCVCGDTRVTLTRGVESGGTTVRSQ